MRITSLDSWRAPVYALAAGVTVLAAIAVFVALTSGSARAQSSPTGCSAGTTVNTASGPVCGFVSNGLTEWLGIPYAVPPVGGYAASRRSRMRRG